MKVRSTRFGLGATSSICVVLLMSASLLGCNEIKGGQDLAQTGSKTAGTLASYYDSLVEDSIDTMEFEAFISSIRGVEYSEADQKPLEDQISALQSRARAARGLSAAYDALANLSNYKAATSITPAAKDLGEALKGIKALPQASGDPSQYVGQAATKLVEWKQARDIRQANEILLTSVSSFQTLFAKESDAYRSISEERGNKVNDILKYLIENNKVSAWPLLDRVPKSLGLSWNANNASAPDAATKQALIAVANARERRLALISANVADELQESLAHLKNNHEQLKAEKSPVEGTIEELVAKARAGLDEMSAIRGPVTVKEK